MRAGVANPPDAFDGTNLTQEVSEQGSGTTASFEDPASASLEGIGGPGHDRSQPGGEVTAIGVDVLAQPRHLGDPVGGKPLALDTQLPEGTAALRPPNRWDDAEGTRVVTTDLDGDPGAVVDIAFRGKRRGKGVGIGAGGFLEDLHHWAVLSSLGEEFGGPVHVVGAEHDVNVCGPLLDDLAVLLGQAPRHCHLQVRPLVLERLEIAQGAIELVVGVLPDATGVEHDDVGLRLRAGLDHPIGLE